MVSAHVPVPQPAVYSVTARFWHWLTAVLVIAMIPLGFGIANYDLGDTLYNSHKSFGFVVFVVVVLRLVYRLTHPVPPLPADIPAIQRLAAHANHWALYALLLAQPVVGWIATSAYPAPIPIFGLFDLPPIWPENRALSDRLYELHGWIGLALAALIALHIAAVIYHQFIRKDNLLARMTG